MFTIKQFSADNASQVIDVIAALTDILIDCVEGGASVSFMQGLSRAQAEAFWREIVASTQRGERVLLLARDENGLIVGTVQVVLSQPDNQPHRADVAKMLVHRRARRQGHARQLMLAAEAAARDHGKSLLVLDTVTGSVAAKLYETLGWKKCGDIPNYALMPTGEPCSTTYYYRAL